MNASWDRAEGQRWDPVGERMDNYEFPLDDEEAHWDLQQAILDRVALGVCPFGPLTWVEQEMVDAYERAMEEMAREHDAEQAAGGRTICPQCGERSVTHRGVYTIGYEGHPGAEMSDLASCERCDYMEV